MDIGGAAMGLFRRRSQATKIQPDAADSRPLSPAADIPDELIAARAYEIWRRRGCPMGQDSSSADWFAARQELEQERLGWAAPRQDDKALHPG
jgi:hypothetical protein